VHRVLGAPSASTRRRRVIVVSSRSDPERQGEEREIAKAVIVRTRKRSRVRMARTSASTRNSAVLVDKDKEPVGTRIFGPSRASCAPNGS